MNPPSNGMFSSGPPADYLIIFAFPIGDLHSPQSTDSRNLRLGSADRLALPSATSRLPVPPLYR